MLRTRENSDVFNSLDEIYLVFTSKKQISSMNEDNRSLVTDDAVDFFNWDNLPQSAKGRYQGVTWKITCADQISINRDWQNPINNFVHEKPAD